MHTCRSFMGFQSCSKKMTVSAPVRLSPSPPTWVVKRRTSTEGSLLNLYMEGGVRGEGEEEEGGGGLTASADTNNNC